MSAWTDCNFGEPSRFESLEWQAEQRGLVARAVARGWIIPPTNGTAPAPKSPPAGNVARKKARRHARNQHNGVLT
jgi:hypothetical protein